VLSYTITATSAQSQANSFEAASRKLEIALAKYDAATAGEAEKALAEDVGLALRSMKTPS